MTEEPLYFDNVRDQIADWIQEYKLERFFSNFYVFGSLIHRDGRHFIAGGVTASDVDLLIRFDDRISGAVDRWTALCTFREHVGNLEHRVASALNRPSAEPIFSILPLTSYEIRQCIHKGHDPKLLTDNIFFDVVENTQQEDGLSQIADYQYHYENLEPFSVMKLCQKYRNGFLAANNLGKFPLQNFDDDEPLPKELMRSAAILRFFDGDKENSARRTDLEEGAKYLQALIDGRADENANLKCVSEKLSGRTFHRGKSEPLTPQDMLLMHEELFDRAMQLVVPSVRDAVREMMEH